MCAGPVWTLTGPSRGCWSPVPVRILPCLPWTCHAPSGEYATSFLCAVWLLFPTKTEFFVWYCSLFWAQCLCQAFKEVKRQLFCVHVHMFVFCVSCFVFFLFVLLLGSIVQFMHTLHSLYRGQLHQLSSHQKWRKFAVSSKGVSEFLSSCQMTSMCMFGGVWLFWFVFSLLWGSQRHRYC